VDAARTDELREAAERLRAYGAATDWTEAGFGAADHYQAIQDRHALADAYLAEHPADDAEPVTAEWLSTLTPDEPNVFATDGGYRIGVTIKPDGTLIRLSGVAIVRNPTRSHVRRLLSALNITPEAAK
jgi:hypothetical protein